MNPDDILESLLARPEAEDDDFDVPGALRRISADVARIRRRQQPPPTWWAEQAHARECLDAVVRTEIAARARTIGGLANLAELADRATAAHPRHAGGTEEIAQEIIAFRLFGCLLHHTGQHPVSAEFWWKIGAGAGDRTSAWCLYLHHLGHGEIEEARLWFDQAVHVDEADEPLQPGVPAPAVPDMEDYFRTAPIVGDVRASAPAAAPPGRLLAEVQRLVTTTSDDTYGIVTCPDRRLADRIEEYASLN
ncbi:hypothetical protein [Kitasatospora cheerisanensis]|uniref:Uncharacterized protein n=1 Tax=Kitasatospora cheerisanensis KCTC 2395 TaxID=1348663 RepID=A0A066YG38_9ACTN|nr:hypothetical protein [Kitasatospora cheerisanensis]KDN80458.1 hypothetical protein KCH_77900 [Kitasatospora cheerisanensis KCTC 2395]